MAGRTVTIEVPDELYDRLSRRAAAAQRSVAAEVVELVAAAMSDDDDLPPELKSELARMETLDDEALWRAAQPSFTVRQSRRLESLHFKLQDEGLTEAERAEEQALLRAADRSMLIRAQALALLKQRGRDIAPLIARR
jgi:hypothetical protein